MTGISVWFWVKCFYFIKSKQLLKLSLQFFFNTSFFLFFFNQWSKTEVWTNIQNLKKQSCNNCRCGFVYPSGAGNRYDGPFCGHLGSLWLGTGSPGGLQEEGIEEEVEDQTLTWRPVSTLFPVLHQLLRWHVDLLFPNGFCTDLR